MLIAAMNPCPCGYYGDVTRICSCSTSQIRRYRAKISGPLLDRIDIHIEVPNLKIELLRGNQCGENSASIRARCELARKVQVKRFKLSAARCNAEMEQKEIIKNCIINDKQEDLLEKAMEQLSLSARAYNKILKVARTIADLDCSDKIKTPHLLEAIQYRSLDRQIL